MNSREIARAIADQLLPTDPAGKMTARALWELALERVPELSAQTIQVTFTQQISQLAQDPQSGITKNVGENGYYLTDPAEAGIDDNDADEQLDERSELAEEADSGTGIPSKTRNNQEQLLYPVFRSYLIGKGYQSEITESMRILGKWGNPDVVGIKIEEGLNGTDVYEFVSIEAKITSANFRYDIFEAVSHRRFFNRSYLAFAAPLTWLSQTHDELRYYSELFHVGVMVAAMNPDEFRAYSNAEATSLDDFSTDVFEVYSAPFEAKPPQWQRQLVNALGLKRATDIALWGRRSDSQ